MAEPGEAFADLDVELLDTIAGRVRAEIEVTRSRFVATLAPVGGRDDVERLVTEVRTAFHDASHHCVASVLGPDGRSTRSNDDGEPAGTAGAPMLAVLSGAGLTDVAAVVTRYFGGTLLGAGGLVRAYGDAVRAAVERSSRVRRQRVRVVSVHAAHAAAGRLEHRLRTWAADRHAVVAPGHYDADGVRLEVAAPLTAVGDLQALLAASGEPHSVELGDVELRDVVA